MLVSDLESKYAFKAHSYLLGYLGQVTSLLLSGCTTHVTKVALVNTRARFSGGRVLGLFRY